MVSGPGAWRVPAQAARCCWWRTRGGRAGLPALVRAGRGRPAARGRQAERRQRGPGRAPAALRRRDRWRWRWRRRGGGGAARAGVLRARPPRAELPLRRGGRHRARRAALQAQPLRRAAGAQARARGAGSA
eukprot:scaffold2076_cov234-Prasinococcus_capsulatus_cf.AAC.1